MRSKFLEDRFVAVDVRFRDFPVVDAGIARLARVGEHDTAVEIFQIDRKRLVHECLPA